MSNNYDLSIERENSKIEPFDKIEQGKKRYIPNIPSVISDMNKNNLYKDGINNNDSKEKLLNNNINSMKLLNDEEKKDYNKLKENNNDNLNYLTIVCDYWNTFRNNETISTIINPFQDDGECINKIYKIYSYITIILILIVILLSITLS